jgi:hypothetical protein
MLAFIFIQSGCVTTSELSALQARQMQSRELQGTFDDAFKATLQVLQDYEYTIKNADHQSGVIQGETGFVKSKNYWWDGLLVNCEITATLEQFGENMVKERLTLVRKRKIDYSGAETASQKIQDPELFKKMYDDIQKEMFVRVNLNR